MPWLNEQIELIKPKVIVLAGSTAVQSFLNIDEPISKLRGKWIIKEDIKYMPIFHPSYLLRNPSKEKGKPKWLTWQDLKKLRRRLTQFENSSLVLINKDMNINTAATITFELKDSFRKITPAVTPTIGTK